MNKENVFIKLSKKKSVDLGENVYIRNIGKVYANDERIKKNIENLKIYNKKQEENWDYIDSMEVVKKVGEYNPDIQVNLLGADDVLLELKSKEKRNGVFEFFKVSLICILLLFGTGLSIVFFHEDVNMAKSIEKLYYTFTGKKDSNPFIMTIPYTMGLGLGMLVFFNRIISSSKRRKKELGPMEIELYLYDADMEESMLERMIQKDEDKR